MEHYDDDLAQGDHRGAGSLLDDGQARAAAPEPRSGWQPAAEFPSNDDSHAQGGEDDMPALILQPFGWTRPPPPSAHGSPTRRRSRVASTRDSSPLSSATTIWVSPESYRLGARARGPGVSPHASAAGAGATDPAAVPDAAVLTVEYDNPAPGTRDNPIGVAPWDDEPQALLVDSLERVGAACLHRFDALDTDGDALCYICQESLLRPPVLDELPPAHEPSSPESGDSPPPAVRAFPCRHLFHEACLAPWLRTHTTCPTCRFDAAPADPHADWDDDDDESESSFEDNGEVAAVIDRLFGDIRRMNMTDTSDHGASAPNPSARSGPTIRLERPGSVGPEGHPEWHIDLPGDVQWRFPWGPQTPPNTVLTSPEEHRTPSVSPQSPFRPRTPPRLSRRIETAEDLEEHFIARMPQLLLPTTPSRHTSELELDEQDSQLLVQAQNASPPAHVASHTIFLPRRNDGDTSLREALSEPVDVPMDEDPPHAPDLGSRRWSLAPPVAGGSRWERRASVPVAAVQPDTSFSEWLAERERAQ